MIWENSHGHRMAQSVVPVGQTQTKSNVRVTSVWLPNVLQNSPSLATATIVRHNNIAGVTSALGHKRTWKLVRVMSALPPKADIGTQSRDVCFVRKADIEYLMVFGSVPELFVV